MATITSPRLASPSPFATPTSSRRTSFSIQSTTSSPARPAAPAPSAPTAGPQARRNRAALRDYYGLKSPSSTTAAPSSGLQHHEEAQESELDKTGFDAQRYVRELLEREGLEGLLKEEGGLITELKNLDGERKALVYNNYSKLITATDTIRKMRSNMDPLAPTTSTLSPAMAHIVGTAEGLATKIRESVGDQKVPRIVEDDGKRETKRNERDTVRWVLGAPKRLAGMVERGEREKAAGDWEEVKRLLNKWEGVGGTEMVRKECMKALELGDEDEESDDDT